MRLVLALLLLLVVPASAGANGDAGARRGGPPTAPTCTSGSIPNRPNHTPYEVTLACSDPNGDALTYTADNPQHGTLSAVTGNTVTFTPTGDYAGPAGFDFHASDGALTGSGTIHLDIAANQAPYCAGESLLASAPRAATVTYTPNCSDVEHDVATIAIKTQPVCGVATLSNGVITDTPKVCTHAVQDQDLFTLTVTDGHGGTSEPMVQRIFFDYMMQSP